ncbi:MAG TPA: hypothetical protein VN958_18430, partial [Chitinophagaceae bacterium]|nr:hypothetical protein [Chitinophagaceae bacterium]
MIKYICFIALGFFLFISNKSFSQDIFQTTNLRAIKVDQISDNDIQRYLQQLNARGITQQQAEQIAISRGMPLSEIQKLRQRIIQINAKTPPNTQKTPQNNLPNKTGNETQGQLKTEIDTTLHVDTTNKEVKPLIDPKIFGSELFNN